MANTKKATKRARTKMNPVLRALKKPVKLPFKLKKW
jgi:hypothetical protein|tara:strand:+ start:328 stop:435 length:108 start_codon:yes stop_codon:yes gene_type:complete